MINKSRKEAKRKTELGINARQLKLEEVFDAVEKGEDLEKLKTARPVEPIVIPRRGDCFFVPVDDRKQDPRKEKGGKRKKSPYKLQKSLKRFG